MKCEQRVRVRATRGGRKIENGLNAALVCVCVHVLLRGQSSWVWMLFCKYLNASRTRCIAWRTVKQHYELLDAVEAMLHPIVCHRRESSHSKPLVPRSSAPAHRRRMVREQPDLSLDSVDLLQKQALRKNGEQR